MPCLKPCALRPGLFCTATSALRQETPCPDCPDNPNVFNNLTLTAKVPHRLRPRAVPALALTLNHGSRGAASPPIADLATLHSFGGPELPTCHGMQCIPSTEQSTEASRDTLLLEVDL